MKKIKLAIGVIAALCGVFIAFGSFKMTGFVVSELDGFGNSGGIIGLVIILVGAIILGKNIYRPGHSGEFGSGEGVQAGNDLARFMARLEYIEEHDGRRPSRNELRDYMKSNHKRLSKMIEGYRERRS